ncbi:cupin domain-containing protein [Psychroflexus aestuariivivens]|uniref:cupin domain-containing protein n=1 Tax=Psychroflexus aestuariivivens TaxID=1795040 RepID=UPI000FD84903|nr:cupin domain-containing protein [Psychroflexus aestuariivivens]
MTKAEIISKLKLEKHPEGGYFKETYRSALTAESALLPSYFDGSRSFSTCIYFMLTSDSFSAFHRVNQDEIWHFYTGQTILLHMISENGDYSKVKIGNRFDQGEIPQFVVPAKVWFSAEIISSEGFALVGCTVSPGFDFKDFELANRKDLVKKFPNHKDIISKLTRV